MPDFRQADVAWLEAGLDPSVFPEPRATGALATAIRERHPDMVYLLEATPQQVANLYDWRWLLMWNAPFAKGFLRRELVHELAR